MTKKKPNIKYVGMVPVSIHGISGKIQPNQTLYLPEEKVRKLVLDKNWERVIPQPTEKKDSKKKAIKGGK